jgi:hypothetical protein
MRNTKTQELLQQARLAIHRGKQRQAREAKQEKAHYERIKAKLDLIADDLAAEGVDLKTPEGQAIMSYVVTHSLVEETAEWG